MARPASSMRARRGRVVHVEPVSEHSQDKQRRFTWSSAVYGLLDAGTGAAPVRRTIPGVPQTNVLIAGSDNVMANDGRRGVLGRTVETRASGIATLAFAPSDPTCATYAVGTSFRRVFQTRRGRDLAGRTSPDFSPAARFRRVAFTTLPVPNVLCRRRLRLHRGYLYRTRSPRRRLGRRRRWYSRRADQRGSRRSGDLSVLYAGNDLFVQKRGRRSLLGHQLNDIPRLRSTIVADGGNARSSRSPRTGAARSRLNLVCTPPTFDGVRPVTDASACTTGTG